MVGGATWRSKQQSAWPQRAAMIMTLYGQCPCNWQTPARLLSHHHGIFSSFRLGYVLRVSPSIAALNCPPSLSVRPC